MVYSQSYCRSSPQNHVTTKSYPARSAPSLHPIPYTLPPTIHVQRSIIHHPSHRIFNPSAVRVSHGSQMANGIHSGQYRPHEHLCHQANRPLRDGGNGRKCPICVDISLHGSFGGTLWQKTSFQVDTNRLFRFDHLRNHDSVHA